MYTMSLKHYFHHSTLNNQYKYTIANYKVHLDGLYQSMMGIIHFPAVFHVPMSPEILM